MLSSNSSNYTVSYEFKTFANQIKRFTQHHNFFEIGFVHVVLKKMTKYVNLVFLKNHQTYFMGFSIVQ